MKKIRLYTVLFASALLLGSYAAEAQTTTKETPKKGVSRKAKGAVIGGVGGAAAGRVIAGKNGGTKGAIIGGVAGAAAGGAIGRKQDKKKDPARYENYSKKKKAD
ncbi:MAG: glycine zipper 2TM domain-containing protein [Adhaeribacter sp.]